MSEVDSVRLRVVVDKKGAANVFELDLNNKVTKTSNAADRVDIDRREHVLDDRLDEVQVLLGGIVEAVEHHKWGIVEEALEMDRTFGDGQDVVRQGEVVN